MIFTHNKRWIFGIIVFIVLMMAPTGRGLGGQLWLDELRETLVIYQGYYPEGNWSPYLEKLTLVKEGIDQANQQLINVAMEEFLLMLRSQAHGINGMAAHALYWLALSLQPRDPAFAAGTAPWRLG
jgi:hypothetical protein